MCVRGAGLDGSVTGLVVEITGQGEKGAGGKNFPSDHHLDKLHRDMSRVFADRLCKNIIDGIVTELARIVCFRITDSPDNVCRTNVDYGAVVMAKFLAYANVSQSELG